MRPSFGATVLAFLAFLAVSAPAAAQEGHILARVTEAATARPLPTVQVAVTGNGVQVGGLTNQNGQVRVAVPAGTYTVEFIRVGFATERLEDVTVAAGQTTDVGVTMESDVFALDEIVVSAGRQLQKKTDAPATMHTVSERTINERPVSTPIEHLYSAPGVDIIRQGIQSANVVVRGFNNIFSGALHALTDNRIAGVPSLRVNLLHFIPSNDQDLERMEVVLGPGSALYGPNTANGVLHFITKSPLAEQGTTVSVAGGERDFFKGMFRTSHAFGESENFGIKLSGQYLRAEDWEFTDPAEVAAGSPEGKALVEAGLRRRGATEEQIEFALSRVGVRDYQIERMSGEVRADWRVSDEATWVFQVGGTKADGIELTGIGAGQTEDWLYSYYQTRFNWNRLFAQVYLNASDAGDSYLVRQGAPLVDNSRMYVAQVQHGFGLGEAMADGQARQDFTYGFDGFFTRPESEGQIYGQYEDEDDIDDLGAYIQSQTAVSDRLDLIAALRVDDSSVLDGSVWSPRAAVVFKPRDNQSFRLTFNRAFSTPTTLNYFLDINAGLVPGQVGQLGFFTRAQGPGPNGLQFQNPDGSLVGIRSPFTPDQLGGAGQILPADPSLLWQYGVGVLQAQGAIDAQTAALLTSDQVVALMADVGINLLDPVDRSVTPLAQATIPDTPALEESTTQTIEVGYQGVIENRIALSADVWFSRHENFTSPLVVRTPLVLLHGPDMAQRLMTAGLSQEQATALATGLAQVPLGVVSSEDVVTETADLVASYVNFGEVDMWGWDIAFKAFLNEQWTLEGTVSKVSDDYFIVDSETDEEVEDFDTVEDVNEVLGLNAPDLKGSITLGFRNGAFTGEGRVRYTSEFPVNSADFVGLACLPGLSENDIIQGCVDSATIFDLLLGYRFGGTGAEVQLNVQNLFDEGHRSFVGVPEIGRFMMLQVKYEM